MTALSPHPVAVAPFSEAGKARSRRGRRIVEAGVRLGLLACAAISILTTVAIIGVLAKETWVFFSLGDVRFSEFFLGTTWSPLLGAEKHFGMWPLVCGTMLVTAVSALVALPFGLVTAIYLSEYAPGKVRAVLKPVLEILAGIPTVVYGFFALAVITPALRSLHEGFHIYNAASAGIAVGIMTLPIVCSLSEDALRGVPRSLREGAYAVGATKFDVSTKVVVPAALSGIVAAYLLAIARAVGETMIVALAAGNAPRLTADPRQEVQTMTAYMVQILGGDAEAHGVAYQSAYAIAGMLFVMTFALTFIGHRVLKRFREVYE